MLKTIILSLFFSLAVFADDATRLQKANDLFEEAGKAALSDPDKSQKYYKEAILNYQFLIDEKAYSSAELFTNTANAYFFAGDLGLAIVNYQKALRLDPGNDDILHNLKFVRSQIVDELPESFTDKILGIVGFWHSWNLTARIALFCLLHLMFWGFIAWGKFNKKEGLCKGVLVSGILGFLMGISVVFTAIGMDNDIDGVITEKEVMARQGNGHIYEPAFMTPLHSGTEFTILESRESWLYVALLDGSKCWLPKQSITLID